MSRIILIALGGGALSGLASLAVVTGVPGGLLVVYLTPLPLFLVGLAHGLKSTTTAVLAGVVMAGLIGGAMAGLLFALMHALPVWMAVRLALIRWQVTDGSGATKEEWTPAGTILGMLAVIAVALFGVAYLLALGEQGGLQGMILSILDRIITYLMPSLQDSERIDLLRSFSAMFPGYLGMSWVVMTIVNGSVALVVLNKIKASLRPTLKMSELTLPDQMSWYLIGAAAVTLIGSLSGQGDLEYIGRNMAMILALPFFFLGLAVVHDLARLTTFPGMLLVVFYVFLLMSGWIGPIVIAGGLLEQWVGIRRRFKTPGSGHV